MFLYKLALRMGRTVGELSAVMPVDELAHWMALDRLSPIADKRFDYLFAQVCLRVFQSAGVKKSRSPRPPGPNDWTINDFLLFEQPDAPQDAKALMAGLFGVRIVKGKSKRTR